VQADLSRPEEAERLCDVALREISCPTLVLDAEEDIYLKGQPDELYRRLTCPKTMIRFTTAEGAGAHCQCGADRLANARTRKLPGGPGRAGAPNGPVRLDGQRGDRPVSRLERARRDLTSSPDGNTINIRYITPDNDETLPCVYYIHGGRMEMSSCYEGNYKTWGRMIAARGVAVGYG
jgi:hypothetical protein